MGFKERDFGKPSYEEESELPTKLVIISCEGSVTEPEYFQAITDKLKDYVTSIVQVKVVEKLGNNSEPADVLANINKYIDEYGYNKEYDSLWLVCDREKVIDRKNGLLAIKPVCDEQEISIALSNPLFELWLLMHVANIDDYDRGMLFDNGKVGRNRKFIDKTLSDLMTNGYNKKRGRFNRDIVSLKNIKFAMEQSAKLSNTYPAILDNLGTNVSVLLEEILDISVTTTE
jgi:hypothetical protein